MGKIIGISGSDVKNGNVEQAMKKVLMASGQDWEIIRLRDINMGYCIGCLKCAQTNKCVLKDDVPEILEKLETSDAIVLGGLARFGRLNALTKVFIERLFPFVHRKRVLGEKVSAFIAGGFMAQQAVHDELGFVLDLLGTKNVGSLILDGNACCFKCGFGETCEFSAFRFKYGNEKCITEDVFYSFNKDEQAIKNAEELGKKIAEQIEKG